MMSDATAEIRAIEFAYCGSNESLEVLCDWVQACIQGSYKQNSDLDKLTHRFKDCHIEFLSKQLLFSVTKTEGTSDFVNEGVMYDIGISIRPYLVDLFGTDDLVLLRENINLVEEDFDELSMGLTHDINTWCLYVDKVFNGLGVKT